MDKDNKLSFKGQHIYTGIDVGKKALTSEKKLGLSLF
jgi:hypothetical protein